MLAVGACKECEPNKASLFGDVKDGACTDIKCWARKMNKYINWRVKGGSLKMVSNEYGQSPIKDIIARGDYVEVAKKGKDRCKSVEAAIVAMGSEAGSELDICVDQNCHTHRGMKSQYGMTPKEQEARKVERKRENEKAKKSAAARTARLESALATIKWPMDERQLDALTTLAFEASGSNTKRAIAKRRALEVEKKKNGWGDVDHDYEGAIKKAIKGMDKTAKLGMAFELLIETGYDSLREGVGKLTQ